MNTAQQTQTEVKKQKPSTWMWVKSEWPLLVTLATASTCIGLFFEGFTALLMLLVLLVLGLWIGIRSANRFIGLVLCIGLLAPERAQASPGSEAITRDGVQLASAGGVAAVIIIVIVAPFVYFKVVPWCKRMMNRTNFNDSRFKDADAAIRKHTGNTCLAEVEGGSTMNFISAIGTPTEGLGLNLQISPTYGLEPFDVDSVPYGDSFYNAGERVEAEHSIISFGPGDMVNIEPVQVSYTIRRCRDLAVAYWEDLFTIQLPYGYTIFFEDAFEGEQMHYTSVQN